MARGANNQGQAKHLLYGPRRLGNGPEAMPIGAGYRPLNNGLTALAILGSSFTDLADKSAVELALIKASSDLCLKGEQWGASSLTLLGRGAQTMNGDIEDGADFDDEEIPEVGQELSFSGRQRNYIRPHPDPIERANKALETCYPVEFAAEDATCIVDTLANLFHIARVRDLDLDALHQRTIDVVAAEGLKRGVR